MNPHPVPNPAQAIAWLSWSTDAFQRAHATGRPVFLSIVTRWSEACAAMEAEVLADPAVAAAVEAHAVPVRVDADLRPDIADRYGLGGWPTTLWLTPDGEMLRGGTYVDAETLIRTVCDVATRYTRDRAALVRQAASARAARQRARSPASAAAAAPADAEADTLEAIRARILHAFDSDYGGFGRDAKFPLAAPLLFALHAGVAAGDDELIAIAETTLDRIADGALSDPDSGAFHRACATRDWREPDRARLLDVQADMIVAYLDAWRLLHHDRFRTRALAALEYCHRSLRERDRERGAFYHAEVKSEPLIVSESNARMMRALVHASQVLDDTRWILAAVDVAERLLPIVYVRASGIAHGLLPGPHGQRPHGQSSPQERRVTFGLLADNILMASALFEIGEAAGQHVYIELAEELTRSCLRRFWDASPADGLGGFLDRIRTAAGAGDVGLLGEPLKPFAINVEAARLLTRLAARTDDATLAARARDTVGYLAVTSPAHGILSSDFGLLLLELGQNAA